MKPWIAAEIRFQSERRTKSIFTQKINRSFITDSETERKKKKTQTSRHCTNTPAACTIQPKVLSENKQFFSFLEKKDIFF